MKNNIERKYHELFEKNRISGGKENFVNNSAAKVFLNISLKNEIEKLNKAAKYIEINGRRIALTPPSDVHKAIAKLSVV